MSADAKPAMPLPSVNNAAAPEPHDHQPAPRATLSRQLSGHQRGGARSDEPSVPSSFDRKELQVKLHAWTLTAHEQYESGAYLEALGTCDAIYGEDALRTDNLLLLGAIHSQLRNFSESIFYNQQVRRHGRNLRSMIASSVALLSVSVCLSAALAVRRSQLHCNHSSLAATNCSPHVVAATPGCATRGARANVLLTFA